jgi:DNA mismatch endonuclease (patch repair protein)
VTKDRLTKERRSWNMSRIRGENTTPERRVRSLLRRLGYRFGLNVKIPVGETLDKTTDEHGVKPRGGHAAIRGWTRMPNRPRRKVPLRGGVRGGFVRPDIVLPKHKTAIFVNGCFWHRHRGCKNCTTPTHRRAWWLKKLEGNATRDKLHQRALRKLGWRNIVVWECQTEKPKSLESVGRRLDKLLDLPLRCCRK